MALFIGICRSTYSQNDTIFVLKDSILIENRYYNRILQGEKQGPWIEYKTVPIIEMTFDHTGNYPYEIKHKYTDIHRKYKPGEYDSVITKEIVEGDIIESKEYVKFCNKIPPTNYEITGCGKYKDCKRHGLWTFYYKDLKTKSKIVFANGLPETDFDVYYISGKIKMSVKRNSNNLWEVCKYDKNDSLISCNQYNIEEIPIE